MALESGQRSIPTRIKGPLAASITMLITLCMMFIKKQAVDSVNVGNKANAMQSVVVWRGKVEDGVGARCRSWSIFKLAHWLPTREIEEVVAIWRWQLSVDIRS